MEGIWWISLARKLVSSSKLKAFVEGGGMGGLRHFFQLGKCVGVRAEGLWNAQGLGATVAGGRKAGTTFPTLGTTPPPGWRPPESAGCCIV